MLVAIGRCLGGAAALAALAASAALVLPASTPAATVDVVETLQYSGTATLRLTATPGEHNDVSIRIAERVGDGVYRLTVIERGAPLETGPGCTGGGQPGVPAICTMHEQNVKELCLKGCPPPQPGESWSTAIVAQLGDGDNTFLAPGFDQGDDVPMLVSGGPGVDRYATGAGYDELDPGIGADEVHAGAGADTVFATPAPDEHDRYNLGASPERAYDEPGDVLDYSQRTLAVVCRLSACGSGSESDTVQGVESIVGGSGGDTLEGGPGRDLLEGGTGDDLLAGQGERDVLHGGPGDDVLRGGDAADQLHGGEQDDTAFGGGGDDRINERDFYGAGADFAWGGTGADTIMLAAGDDFLFGGPGDDRLGGGRDEDVVTCGRGAEDTVVFPARDALQACELLASRRR